MTTPYKALRALVAVVDDYADDLGSATVNLQLEEARAVLDETDEAAEDRLRLDLAEVLAERDALRRDLDRAHDSGRGFLAEIAMLKQQVRELRAFQAMVNRHRPEFPADPDGPRDVWYWQGDGEDRLESMTHQLPVVIRAEQLREVLAEQAKPAPAGWRFERIDERTIKVKCPTYSTPLEVSLNTGDRRALAFYNLAADLIEALAAQPASSVVGDTAPGFSSGVSAASPAEGHDMLEPLIYAAIMHSGRPKTIGDFENAAANVADMLKRRAQPQPMSIEAVWRLVEEARIAYAKFMGADVQSVSYGDSIENYIARAIEGARDAQWRAALAAQPEWRCPDTGRTCTAEDCGRECVQASEGDGTYAVEHPIAKGWELSLAEGHAGYGVYAHMPDAEDEGSILVLEIKGGEAEMREAFMAHAKERGLDTWPRIEDGKETFAYGNTLAAWNGFRAAWAARPNVQPKGIPVAWSRQQFIHDDDGYSIGTDEPELHWGKEPPDDETGWHPLYAAAGVTTRDAALEEAAQLCERWNTTPGRKLAGEIRALAAQAPAPAPGPHKLCTTSAGCMRILEGCCGPELCQLADETAPAPAVGAASVELPPGMARSDAEFWLRKRGEIIDALRAEGLTMVTTLNGVQFMRLGRIEAQSTDEVAALVRQAREVCAATLRAGPGVAVEIPAKLAEEGRKFMRGEPNLIEQMPFADVQKLGDLLGDSHVPVQHKEQS